MLSIFRYFSEKKRHEEAMHYARKANQIAEENAKKSNQIAEKSARTALYIGVAAMVLTIAQALIYERIPFFYSGEEYSFIYNDPKSGKPLIKGESGSNANRDGRWLMYYPSKLGSGINIDANYEDNILNGLYTEYYQNGNKKIEGEYDDGSPYGVWYEYSIDNPEPIRAIDHTKPFFLVKIWNNFFDDDSGKDNNEEDKIDNSPEPFFLVNMWKNFFDDASNKDE